MSEATLVRACLDYLRMLPGCVAFRLNAGLARQGRRVIRLAPAGAPDILACWNGVALGIECKVATTVAKKFAGRRAQNDAQIAFQAAWEAAGGTYLVVLDVDELILWVKQQPDHRCACAKCARKERA